MIGPDRQWVNDSYPTDLAKKQCPRLTVYAFITLLKLFLNVAMA